jgi:hypothetical protein
VLPVEILERASVIEKDRHAGQMERGLIALIALFAHFYLETGDPQPQSSLDETGDQTERASLIEEGSASRHMRRGLSRL